MSSVELISSRKLAEALKRKLTADGPERGGVITPEGKLVELKNIADKPDQGFLPEITVQTIQQLDAAVGTWHTHPGATANLSVEDWETFVQWPDLLHAIVGTDGVRWYRVENGTVLNA